MADNSTGGKPAAPQQSMGVTPVSAWQGSGWGRRSQALAPMDGYAQIMAKQRLDKRIATRQAKSAMPAGPMANPMPAPMPTTTPPDPFAGGLPPGVSYTEGNVNDWNNGQNGQGRSWYTEMSQVNDLFRNNLGRLPDHNDREYYDQRIASGAPMADIQMGILTSPEAVARRKAQGGTY